MKISVKIYTLGLAMLCSSACGGGQYGYSRTYSSWGDEGQYLSQEVALTYEDVRRFPERHAEEMIGWFGIVRGMEVLDAENARIRLHLELRGHRERHLCSDEASDTCRVTVTDRELGLFQADITVRDEDRGGRQRLSSGSLVKIYAFPSTDIDEEHGPILEALWYRHWPHGTFVTTASARRMRR